MKKEKKHFQDFTVRKISFGEGVERTFALYSPILNSIKVVRSGKVRRAKLYYLRERKGKSARIAEKIKKKIGIDLDIENTESDIIVSENKANENISKETTSDKLKDNKDKKE